MGGVCVFEGAEELGEEVLQRGLAVQGVVSAEVQGAGREGHYRCQYHPNPPPPHRQIHPHGHPHPHRHRNPRTPHDPNLTGHNPLPPTHPRPLANFLELLPKRWLLGGVGLEGQVLEPVGVEVVAVRGVRLVEDCVHACN
jgi:hypothetical protein